MFRTRSLRTAFDNAVTAAKLDDVTFHTLRHTFASWAMQRGVSLPALQRVLGHSSLSMTMRYAHLAPDHLRSVVAALEGLTNGTTALHGPRADQQPATVDDVFVGVR